MRHLASTVKSLRSRVAERLDVRSEVLEMSAPFYEMHSTKIALLRIIQIWLFYDTMMVQIPSFPCNQDKSVTIPLVGPPIQHSHLEQILDPETHDFQIENHGKIVQQGNFDASDSSFDDYMATFRLRFISYMLEKRVDLSFNCVGTSLNILVPTDVWESSQLLRDTIIGMLAPKIETIVFQGNTGAGNQRGVRGRACGAWYPESVRSGDLPTKSITIISSEISKQDLSLFKKEAEIISSNGNYSIKSVVYTEIKETKKKVSFVITAFGDCHEIAKIDLCDIFADPHVQSTARTERLQQSITFALDDDDASNSPLITDGPEGARLLSVLASERRRDNFIRLCDGDHDIDINIPRSLSINGKKGWKRKNGGTIYVLENSVCSAVLPIDKSKELFACCTNTLDLRGGACKVEGVTLIPPGRMFCCLALLSFGINPRTSSPIISLSGFNDGDEKKDSGIDNTTVQDALSWIRFSNGNEHLDDWRVKEALRFHMGCMELGETLEVQPEKIETLCAFFDGVNGHQMTIWEGFDVSLSDVNASLRRKPKVQKKRGVPEKGKKKGRKKGQAKCSTETGEHHESNTTFLCPGCNDAFPAVGLCKDHMQSCCFGLVRDQDPIVR